jgi:hypothetical protein
MTSTVVKTGSVVAVSSGIIEVSLTGAGLTATVGGLTPAAAQLTAVTFAACTGVGLAVGAVALLIWALKD